MIGGPTSAPPAQNYYMPGGVHEEDDGLRSSCPGGVHEEDDVLH